MKIVINSSLLFDTSEKTLTSNSHQVKLSRNVSMLLFLMLKNKNNIVTRDVIYKLIWEDYNLSPSGSSLNNYISILRRVFGEFGMTGIVETIHRTGFLIKIDDVIFDYPINKNQILRRWLKYSGALVVMVALLFTALYLSYQVIY